MHSFTFNHKDFTKLIRSKRIIEDVLTTAQAASLLGISPSELNRIEGGKRPSLDDYAKLCKWIERDMSEFISVSVSGQVNKTKKLESQSGR